MRHNVVSSAVIVAPYVGAWIETGARTWCHAWPWVAPYVGAWIETDYDRLMGEQDMSHPMWVRGLKR